MRDIKLKLAVKDQLKKAAKTTYLPALKQQLSRINCKIKMWLPYDEGQTYYAYFDTRSVIIPVPLCDYSYMVGLHEIGHISEGERQYSYLQEYRADVWSIKTAKQTLNVESVQYVLEAKAYVLEHLIYNIAHQGLKIEKVKPYVLEWLEHTPESLELLFGDRDFVKCCVARIDAL